MSDPFSELFGGLFGSSPPSSDTASLQGKHYEDKNGKHYILLWQMDGFHGAFAAVEVEGPEDRSVHGKPLCFVNHAPSRSESLKKEGDFLRGKAQGVFVREVEKFYDERGETVDVTEGFLRSKKRLSAWSRIQPGIRKLLKREEGFECPDPECRGWERTSLFGFGRGFESVPKHDRFVDDGFCREHRILVEAYLAENPDMWPPKEEE